MTIITSPLNMIFSLFFPVLMLQIMYNAILGDIPEIAVETFGVTLFISYLLIIPMALILMGFSTDTADQRTRGILERLNLFGFSYRKIIFHKVAANICMLLFCIIVYIGIGSAVIPIPTPNVSTLIITILALSLLTLLLFLMGSTIALTVPNNGTAISVAMIIYFALMIFSGLMGVSPTKMPEAIQVISKTLPTYYISQKLPAYWVSGGFNSGKLFLYLLIYISIFSALLFLITKKRTQKAE